MQANQINYFQEYTRIRNIPDESKRTEYLETLLVKMNQGLIYHVSRRLPLLREIPEEVLCVGEATLLRAIRNYNPIEGDFGPYAVRLLRSSDGLASLCRFYASGPIKIPHNAHVEYIKEKRLQRENPEYQLSEESQAIERAMNSVCRFDNEETGNSLEDTLEQGTFPAPWEAVEREQMRAALSHVLASLDDRERFIVESLFGMRCGEDEDAPDLRGVGDAISLSHERVRNIRDKAIDRLKKRMHKYLNIVE